MYIRAISHVALIVADLRDAEAYYRHLFGMEVAFRETLVQGEWRTFRTTRTWHEYEKSWPQPMLTMLQRDQFILALEYGRPTRARDQLDHIGLWLDQAALKELRWRTADTGCQIVAQSEELLVIVDRYDVQWELNAAEEINPRRQSSGERSGRWVRED